MRLFRAAGHTSSSDAAIVSTSIENFVYLDIQHDQVLTPQDWSFLDQVCSVSLLFSINSRHFDTFSNGAGIDYYAVSLSAANGERSVLAHGVHRVLSRLSKHALSVVLFEANGFVMFSLAKRGRGQSCGIVLSDWFSLCDITETDVLLRIDASGFASDSAVNFFYDFEYAIARPYYRYPVSYEYARYQALPAKLHDGESGDEATAQDVDEMIREIHLWPLFEYGDDYVFEEDSNQTNEASSAYDFALALLELEIDDAERREEDDSWDYDLSEEVDDDNDPDAEESFLGPIDDDVLNDPVRLLHFIGKHST